MDSITAHYTLQCWGCQKSSSFTSSCHSHTIAYSNFLLQIKNQGWIERQFGPNALAWFCSQDCAFNSLNAYQAESWSKDKDINQAKLALKLPPAFWGALLFALTLLVAMLLTIYINH